MFKRFLAFSFTMILFLAPHSLLAQTQVESIQSLTIDFWPDYDRAANLVLMTGVLPQSAVLPATVTLPLPETADLNAIARINAENMMIDDIEYTWENGQVTLITPERRFRIEYYIPYAADGDQRSFTFTWLANIAVEQFQAKIQQPTSASALLSQPAATNVYEGGDGFTYHELPGQPLPAGQPYSLNVNYTMRSALLSRDGLGGAAVDLSASNQADSGNEINWPLILGIAGGVIIAGVIIWQLMSRQTGSNRPRKPQPRRPETGSRQKPKPKSARPAQPKPKTAVSVRFCRNCGKSVNASDKFCRHCGTAVKQ